MNKIFLSFLSVILVTVGEYSAASTVEVNCSVGSKDKAKVVSGMIMDQTPLTLLKNKIKLQASLPPSAGPAFVQLSIRTPRGKKVLSTGMQGDAFLSYKEGRLEISCMFIAR